MNKFFIKLNQITGNMENSNYFWWKISTKKDINNKIVSPYHEYSTITPRRKNITQSPVNRCHRHQHHGRTFMVRRSCSVSGGTKRVLFTMNCWNLAIPLRTIGIGYNWFVWAMHCEKNGREYEQRHDNFIMSLLVFAAIFLAMHGSNESIFFMTTLGLMSLKS